MANDNETKCTCFGCEFASLLMKHFPLQTHEANEKMMDSISHAIGIMLADFCDHHAADFISAVLKYRADEIEDLVAEAARQEIINAFKEGGGTDANVVPMSRHKH